MILKTIRLIDDGIDRCLNLFFILLLLLSVYFGYDTYYVFKHSRADSVMTYKPTEDDPEVIKNLSNEVVGWITINDTTIDYPIMQGEDNSEYLNKDPYGKYNLSGSIFLDSRNNADFSNDYSLIYGHHLERGYMFGALDEFEKESYFNNHSTGKLTVVNDRTYDFEILAYVRCDASDEIIFNVNYPTDIAGRRGWVLDHAFYSRSAVDGKILIASTCASPLSTERKILVMIIRDR